MRFLGILIVFGLIFSMVRGCSSMLNRPPQPEPPEFETEDEPRDTA